MTVTGYSERTFEVLLHFGGDVIIRQRRRVAMKVSIRFEREVIHRQMRRRNGECCLDIGTRFVNALSRQTVHQIKIEVIKVRARDIDGAARLIVVMDAPQRLEMRRIKTLDADRQPVDAGGAKAAKFFRFESPRVGFEGDLRIHRQRQTRTHRRDDLFDAGGGKHAGCAAAEKHRIDLAPPDQR